MARPKHESYQTRGHEIHTARDGPTGQNTPPIGRSRATMQHEIDLDGATVRVTPIEDLGVVESMTALVLLNRIERAKQAGKAVEAGQAVAELAQLCAEDGITADTIRGLDPDCLSTLIEAVLPDGAVED